MAIQWGPISNHFRIGIEILQFPWPVGTSDSRVRLHIRLWGESQGYGHNWNYPVNLGGDWSGSPRVQFYSGTGQTVAKVLYEQDVWIDTRYDQNVGKWFHASLTGFGASNVSVPHWIGRRPYSPPRQPRNASVSHPSDGRAIVSWVMDADGDNGPQPWRNVEVYRTGADGQRRKIVDLGWQPTSFEDSNVPRGEALVYEVASRNEAGTSALVHAGRITSRPFPPRNVRAEKSGQEITISWEYPSDQPGYLSGFTIYDGASQVGTAGPQARSWTHTSPSTTQTHTYRVLARVSAPALESEKSEPSNTVQLLTKPSAPTLLDPAEHYVAAGVVRLRWSHNPLDSSAQTRAQVRYRNGGGSSWTTKTIYNGDAFLDITRGVGSCEWQVRTWGSYLPGQDSGASPWSPIDAFEVVTPPSVSINAPTGTVNTSTLTVSWAYYQAQGSGQSSAQVRVYVGSTILEDATLQGAKSSWTMEQRLEHAKTYRIEVRTKSGHGHWSTWSSKTIQVSFLSPPPPKVNLIWDDIRGAVGVHITNPPPSGNTPAAVSNDVWRSVDSGQTWELVTHGAGTNTVILDHEALSWGETQYRVSAVSALPSTASTLTAVEVRSKHIWIGADPGFPTQVRLPYNPKISFQTGLIYRKIHQFAGRTHGVEMAGTARQRTASISSLIIEDDPTSESSTSHEAEELGYKPAPFIYRDPTGRRIYCSLTDVNISRSHLPRWAFSAKLEEISRE